MNVSRAPASSVDGTLDALRDPTGSTLRAQAASDPKAAIKAAAKQFEAMFMQQLMKSMRESSMSSGMLENSGTQMGTEMLDTQFAGKMARAADTGRPHADPARIGLGVADELGDGFRRNRRVDRERRRCLGDAGDRQHVAHEVEAELFVEGGVDRIREIGDEQRVAVGR